MSKNIKISDASIKQLRRLPSRERIICEQVLKNEVIDWMHITSDTIVMGALIVLIEEDHYGKNIERDDSRLRRFAENLQELIDYTAGRYDQAMAEALRRRLHNHGIDYDGMWGEKE